MKPIETTDKKLPMKHSYQQKRVIKTDLKPKVKATIIARKPVAEVKIDLSSKQHVNLSAESKRFSFHRKTESFDEIYGMKKVPLLGTKSTRQSSIKSN